jgi:hypothetical protein
MMPQPWEMDRANVANIHKRNQELNQEIEDLYLEVEELHRETAVLMGLMAGSYAYFLQRLMLAHQDSSGLSAQDCEKIVVDALKRVQSSQNRFEYDFLSEIQAVLQKMSQPLSLDPYLEQIQR